MRPDDDDDRDDRPQRRSRPRDDDHDEDRDADDTPRRPAPKKKSSNLGLILGILGGMLLLGCGVCGGLGIWIVSKTSDAIEQFANARVTTENALKLSEGMTQSQVEAILGPGRPLTAEDIRTLDGTGTSLTNQRITEDHAKYWGPWANKGLVHHWRNGTYYILVAYNDPPEAGGKLKGLDYYTLDGGLNVHNERIKLPRMLDADADARRHGLAAPKTQTQTDPLNNSKGKQPPDVKIRTNITADELIQNPSTYLNRVVTVTGTIKDISPTADGGIAQMGSNSEKSIRFFLNKPDVVPAAAGGHKGTLVIQGKVTASAGLFVDVTECRLISSTGTVPIVYTNNFAAEFAANAEKAHAKYDGKLVRLQGQILSFPKGGITGSVVLRGNTSSKAKGKAPTTAITIVIAYPDGWKGLFAEKRLNENITISGVYSSFDATSNTITINNGWLLPGS